MEISVVLFRAGPPFEPSITLKKYDYFIMIPYGNIPASIMCYQPQIKDLKDLVKKNIHFRVGGYVLPISC